MKNFKFLFIIISMMGTLWSCQKYNTYPKAPDGVLSALINDQEWNSSTVIATISETNFLTLVGVDANGSHIDITIPNVAVKAYQMDWTTLTNSTTNNSTEYRAFAYTYVENSNAQTYTTYEGVAGGTVEITAIDKTNKRISGIFNLVISAGTGEVVKIKRGQFNNIPYNKDQSTTTGGTGNGGTGTGGTGNTGNTGTTGTSSLSAKINGTPWSPGSVTAVLNTGYIIVGSYPDASGNQITFNFPAAITANTYTVSLSTSPTTDPKGGLVVNNVAYTAESGTIVISSHDTTNKRIKGTFSITYMNVPNTSQTATATDGVFDIYYQ